MKIAIVSGSFPPQPCGVGDYTERLAVELDKAGIHVDVVTSKYGERAANRFVRYELDDWRLSNWRQAVQWMVDQSYDIVHVQYPAKFYGYRPGLALLTAILRRRLPRTPIVVTVHEFRITHFLRKLTVASIVSRSDAITLTAESERALYERWLPWVRNKLHVVHLAGTIPTLQTGPDERKAVRRHLGIQEEQTAIGYFGFLHPNKGIERLLKSFAIVHTRRPATRLVMMSLYDPSSNKFHAAVEQLLSSLKIQEAVVWTGFLSPEEVSHHLGSVDVAVFPFVEGVSLRRLSFITALSHGIPTVTTSGQADPVGIHLRDGENVILVAARDSAQAVAERVLELIESKPLQLKLSKAGRDWAEPFQWENVVQETLEVYHSVVH